MVRLLPSYLPANLFVASPIGGNPVPVVSSTCNVSLTPLPFISLSTITSAF